MQDLRIVGVDAEGEKPQLLLSDEAGAEYALPIDEALKSAVARRRSPAAQRSAAVDTTHFSPREIQARLRAGATVDQVVEASGLSAERVLRYAGPVADERAFYASRARQTVVARASTAENHRLAFGDAPATLEDMVRVRLRALGVNLGSVSWDAWRREDGLWAVFAHFDTSSSAVHAEAIGQQPPAEWVFDPAGRSVRPVNEWADSLSTLPPAEAKQRSRRRLAVVDEPFDVDESAPSGPSGGAKTGPDSPGAAAETADGEGTAHEDLLDILRARRGQRLGSDESGDEKLATLLTRDEEQGGSAVSPLRAVADAENASAEAADGKQQQDDPQKPPEHREPDGTDAWGFSYADSGDDETAEAPEVAEQEIAEESEKKPAAQQEPPRRKKSSSRRPTMPRWDDILFGSKDDQSR